MSSGNRASLRRALKMPIRLADFEVDPTGDFGMGAKEAEIEKSKRFLERQRKKNNSGTTKKATRPVAVPSASPLSRRGRPKKATARVPTSSPPTAVSGSKAQPPPSSARKRTCQPMDWKFCDKKSTNQKSGLEDSDEEENTVHYDDSDDEDFEPGTVSSDSEDELTTPKSPSQPLRQVRQFASAHSTLASTSPALSQRSSQNAQISLRNPKASSNTENQEPPPKKQRLLVPLSSCPPEVAAFLKRNSIIHRKPTANVRPLKVRSASQKEDENLADQGRSAVPLTTSFSASNCSRKLTFALYNAHTSSHSQQEPDFDDYGGNENQMDLSSALEEREFDDQDNMEHEPQEQQQDNTTIPEPLPLLEQVHDVETSVEDVTIGVEESSGEDNSYNVAKTVTSTPVAPLPSFSGSSDQPASHQKKNFEVEVVPKRMFFNAPFDKKLRNTMLLKNNSDQWLAYKLTFSNPERHTTVKYEALIQPNQTREITVSCASFGAMKAWDEDEVHEVVVKFVKIPEQEWKWDKAWFKDEEVVETRITEIRHSN